MKLVGKLKEDVSKAQSPEEARELIEAAGIQLTDEELECVAGGYIIPREFGTKVPKYNKDGNIIGWEGGVFY